MADKEKLDIMHHIMDDNKIEFFNMEFHLPHLELFGMDISITKHVVFMWIAAGLMMIIFPLVFRKKTLVPTGFRNMLEAILLFIRDDVVRPNMGESGDKYLPFLWSTFFFILFCNLLGLVPFGATATGNFSVTVSLALVSFFFIHFSGIRENGFLHYLGSIVPHVPLWLWPLMLIVEVMGILIKPAALAIRLFANMTAGHVVIFVILGFIFAYKSAPIIAVSVIGTTLILVLELFIAFLQAYIFTFLTAVFMGLAMHPEH